MTDPAGRQPGEPSYKIRTVATLNLGDDTTIRVDHVFDPGVTQCPDCGNDTCISAGMVGMVISDLAPLMTADEALLLANRLTRAANLVLAALEDSPDPEREVAMFGPVPDSPEGLD